MLFWRFFKFTDSPGKRFHLCVLINPALKTAWLFWILFSVWIRIYLFCWRFFFYSLISFTHFMIFFFTSLLLTLVLSCFFLRIAHINTVSTLGQTPSTTLHNCSTLTHSWGVCMGEIILCRLQALRGHIPLTVPWHTPLLPACSSLPAEPCPVPANPLARSTNSICHVGSTSTVQSCYENHVPPDRKRAWHEHAAYTRLGITDEVQIYSNKI